MPVTDLDFHAPTNTLVAATYGRGLFRNELLATTPVVDLVNRDFEVTVFPNPVSAILNISFELDKRSSILAYLADVSGRQVKPIANTILENGEHQWRVDVGDLSKGTYTLILQMDKEQKTTKLILVH